MEEELEDAEEGEEDVVGIFAPSFSFVVRDAAFWRKKIRQKMTAICGVSVKERSRKAQLQWGNGTAKRFDCSTREMKCECV